MGSITNVVEEVREWTNANRINPVQKATVMFTFDQPTVDNRASILEEYGFRGCYAHRMTTTDSSGANVMRELCARGHDYSIYAGNGSLPAMTSDKEAWKTYVQPILDAMAEMGYTYPTMYSCSQHRATKNMQEGLSELGFKYIRADQVLNNTAEPDHSTIYTRIQTNSPTYPYFHEEPLKNGFENVKAKIDTAIENNYTVLLFSHTFAYDNYSEETFRQIVEYIASKVDEGVLECLTPKQYYDKYRHENDYQNLLLEVASLKKELQAQNNINFAETLEV